jgi:hypothetical protein
MSVVAASSAPDENQRGTGHFLLLVWAVAVLSLAVGSGINTLSTDDATRLVEVRDFLAGQNWFDMTQYRLDPPAGVVTHWSRLLDLPIALIVKSVSLAASAGLAEKIALIVWPSALLLLLLAGLARLARELSGETAARLAIVLAVLMAPVLQNFRTGAIHHHNIQIVLLIWALAFFVHPIPRNAAMAGLLGALSVAIGQEMAPAVATLAAIAGLRWIVLGDVCRQSTIAYAVVLASGTIFFAIATVAPADYFAVHCDAISIAQAMAMAIGGFGLAALAALRPNSVAMRAVGAGCIAVLVFAFVATGAPQCIGDPYAALDPRLAALWLASVSEARNLFSMLRDLPQQVPAYFGIPVAAVGLGIARCIRERDEKKWNWIACTASVGVLLLISVWEIRGAGGANALSAALLPAALLQMMSARKNRASWLGVPRPALIALLVLNPATLVAFGSGAAQAFTVAASSRQIIASGDTGTCQQPADYAPLKALPPGLVLAFIDSGPFILMETSHGVLAAPYHRNQTGNTAMFDMLLATPEQAYKRIIARGVDYVAFCPGAPERYNYANAAPNGLVAALANDQPPGFLERMPFGDSGLVVYRVRR